MATKRSRPLPKRGGKVTTKQVRQAVLKVARTKAASGKAKGVVLDSSEKPLDDLLENVRKHLLGAQSHLDIWSNLEPPEDRVEVANVYRGFSFRRGMLM